MPVQETAAALFYERLLTLDPQLTALFEGDMNEQGRKLMAMIRTVVDHSHCLGLAVPTLRELERQDSYGAANRNCDAVAAALTWTLEHELGADFTAETRNAWTACYGILADEMRAVANDGNMPLLPPC